MLYLSVYRVAGGKPEVIFSLSDQLAAKEPTDAVAIPRDHKFVLTGMGNHTQTLALLSQEIVPQGIVAPSLARQARMLHIVQR